MSRVARIGSNLIRFPGGGAIGLPNADLFSTDFTSTENPISEGGIWLNGAADGLLWHNMQTGSGNAYASSFMGVGADRYSDDLAILKPSYISFPANQYAEATLYRNGSYASPDGHEIELLLRFSISSNDAHGYEIIFGCSSPDKYMAIVRWNGGLGDYTALYDPGAGSVAMNDGDVFRAEIIGNILSVYRNGSLISGASVDITGFPGSVWNSGQPGMGSWPIPGAGTVLADLGWKSFRAGSL